MCAQDAICCCECMSVFMVLHEWACVPGVQLRGRRCCWKGRWMYFVRVTGSVVGLAVLWVGVLHIIVKELVLLYVRLYKSICHVVFRVTCKIVCSRKTNFDVSSQTIKQI